MVSCQSVAGQPRFFLEVSGWSILFILVVHGVLLFGMEFSTLGDQFDDNVEAWCLLFPSILFYLYVIVAFLQCTLTEPGILPPRRALLAYYEHATDLPSSELGKKCRRALNRTDKHYDAVAINRSRSSESMEAGGQLTRRPSTEKISAAGNETGAQPEGMALCEVYRQATTSHCSICQRCIIDHDHHCSIVGACIGTRNRRYFVRFNFGLLILASLSIGISVYNLRNFSMPDGWGMSAGAWWSIFGVTAGVSVLVGIMAAQCCGCVGRICQEGVAAIGGTILLIVYGHILANSPEEANRQWSSLLVILVSALGATVFLPISLQQGYLICREEGTTVKQYVRRVQGRADENPETSRPQQESSWAGFVRLLDYLVVPRSPPASLVILDSQLWEDTHLAEAD